MSQQVDKIQSQVVQERDLKPKEQVPVVLLSADELRTNVTNDFLSDYTDEKISDDVLELSTIGLLDPNFDFKTFYINLLSEGVAGYYDPETKEMFVVQGEGFKGPEHLTYAHEYTHVLQDQNYDIRNNLKYNDDYCDADSEYCAAIQALIEGDATQSEFSWFQNDASHQDQLQIVDFMNSLNTPVYDSAPPFMKADFVFPYVQGLSFVQSFYDQGGWQAVDALYKNPPVSTEQILHPSHYPNDPPKPVDLPDVASALGEGWQEVTRNQMGEWDTYLILSKGINPAAQIDDTTAQNAAAGWGGDEYLLLHNDSTNATGFVLKTIWDSASEADEFASAFQTYANARFGVQPTQTGDTLTWTYDGGFSSFQHSGDTTIWTIAPDSATAQTISSQVQP
jgi:hypothetical protein